MAQDDGGAGTPTAGGDVDSADPGSAAPAQVVTFRSGHRAEIVRDQPSESLTLRTRDGHCMLAIEMTDHGALLRLSGESLEIAASAKLSLRAERLEIAADSASFDIGGDLTERVAGDVRREAQGAAVLGARSLGIEARQGGVAIKANDDVDLQGERVRLNCEDPPMPLSWDEFQERRAKLAPAAERPALPEEDASESRDDP